MTNIYQLSSNSFFPTTYDKNAIITFANDSENNLDYKEDELDLAFIFFSEKKMLEKELFFTNKFESNFLANELLENRSQEKNKKIIFVSEKENLEKINNKNNIYRKDAYYKHFKAIFARYIRQKANKLKNICFPYFNQNNFSALSYKYTGNPKDKDNCKFLSFSIKDLLIFGKNEKIKNRQYNNELLINFIEKNQKRAKDKAFYEELIIFLNNTVENELNKFYRNKIEFEKINKDQKCIFFDKYYKCETGQSLLEIDGYIKILKKL